MATYAERIQALANSIINATATTAQINHLGQAFAWRSGLLQDYNSAGNAVKAQIAIQLIRNLFIEVVKNYDSFLATEAARLNASNAVDVEFTEAP